MSEENKEIKVEEAAENGGEKNPKNKKEKTTAAGMFYDIAEMLAFTTIAVMLLFAFVVRLNIVDGNSMLNTLHNGEYLAVSNLFYEPKAGDIVIVHKINADPYTNPLVKRVIATEGQVVDIDFSTWTLTVDGEVVEEPYRYVDPSAAVLTADYSFPIRVPENSIFVMGDNRSHSADSRQIEIGTIDRRCVVGKALARLSPISRFEIFKNPFSN